VPGVISWPAVIKSAQTSWVTAITSDFLPTMMDVLNVQRAGRQAGWAMDGVSLLPLLRGEEMGPRCIGHLFNNGKDQAFR
jgi:arylsulfatase A-like enzyme